MKVLWLINAPFGELCEAAGLPVQVKEGWIQGLYTAVRKLTDGGDYGIRLYIAFPQMTYKETVEGDIEGTRFFGFYKEEDKPYKYNGNVEKRLRTILSEVEPDVVHIAGTEYDHACAMVRSFPHPERILVSIQGLTSVYARHYMADLPVRVRYRFTFRDFIKWDNLRLDQMRYVKRGRMEQEILRTAGHIAGRTGWDYACTRRLNPDSVYHHCGEILRASFYDGSRWEYENCEKDSVFVSQGYYPIKGLHYMLEAMADIIARYPQAKLYVAGGVTLNDKGFVPRLKQKSYQKYLSARIKRYGLGNSVVFLPPLREEEMKAQYMKANVFVSASSIENSPNSLGEAMMLGVPCVASLVGGVADMLVHETEGYTYQHDAPYMLAHYVMRLFEECETSPDKVRSMSEAAAKHSSELFDRDNNARTMLAIYGGIYENNSMD